jgi:multiple sugar transport system permease protein
MKIVPVKRTRLSLHRLKTAIRWRGLNYFIKRTINTAIFILLTFMVIITVFPVLFIVTNSFMSENEIIRSYGGDMVYFHVIPESLSLNGYFTVFLSTPAYLIKFWNSMLMVMAIVAGQTIIACFSAYGFSKFNFPLKNLFIYLLIVLMMLPNQVTLVSNYIVLDRMGLIGSYAAIILPGIFSAFGVFLLIQVFGTIPNNLIEAARLEGANHFCILFKIIIPYGKTGISALVILCFIDNWNMVEQPLIFLKDYRKYPLSVFLSNINNNALGVAFVCAILAIIPVIFLFLFLKDALIKGIESANFK